MNSTNLALNNLTLEKQERGQVHELFPGTKKNPKAKINTLIWKDENGNEIIHPYVPKVKAHFFNGMIFTDIKVWSEALGKTPGIKSGFMLTGPTGSGKTSIVRQYAARINMPLTNINASDGIEEHHLIGQFILAKDGSMEWRDGPLTIALRYGYWFLIDEIDLLDPSIQAGLNSILDGSPLQVSTDKGHEVIHPHPNFRFFATANTKGKGNTTGVYNGTQAGNEAAWDRFQGTEEVWYLEPQEEWKIAQLTFKDEIELNEKLVKAMISCANKIRTQFIGNSRDKSQKVKNLSSPMSTRTLLNWIANTYMYKGLKNDPSKPSPAMYSLTRSLGFRLETHEQAAVEEIVKTELSKIKTESDLV
jgi:cobaltochelatase CobS